VELWAPPLTETLRRGVSEELTWSTTPEEGAPAIVMIVDHASRVHLILRWQRGCGFAVHVLRRTGGAIRCWPQGRGRAGARCVAHVLGQRCLCGDFRR